MSERHLDINRLEKLITQRCAEYEQAIRDDKNFDEVKIIYGQIKELRRQADALMQKAIESGSQTSAES